MCKPMQDGAPFLKTQETQNLIEENYPDLIKVNISRKREIGEFSKSTARFAGSESNGLLDLGNSGSKSMFEATPIDRSVEKESD